ncbi:MAG: YdcF family protein [Candidatus Methanoperedens sp.]|nr:YdcF family protein [Candidatus Methanoperedens sp.]
MPLNKKAWKKITLTAALIFILLLITALAAYFYLLPGIASFLIVETDLQHSDVIIILGGDKERVPYGVKLYKANYSNKIIVTGGMLNIPHINTTWAELEKEEALGMGVPRDDILLVDKSNTTYEDAQFAREIMLQNNFSSAIVVSSPYHMRRAAWLFGRVFKEDNISLFYSPVENSWFKPEKWWTDERKMHVILDEYAKFVYYLIAK